MNGSLSADFALEIGVETEWTSGLAEQLKFLWSQFWISAGHTSTSCSVCFVLQGERSHFQLFQRFLRVFLVVSCRFQRVAVIAQSLGLHKKLKFGRRAAVSGSKEKLNKAKDRVLSTHSLEHSFEEVS